MSRRTMARRGRLSGSRSSGNRGPAPARRTDGASRTGRPGRSRFPTTDHGPLPSWPFGFVAGGDRSGAAIIALQRGCGPCRGESLTVDAGRDGAGCGPGRVRGRALPLTCGAVDGGSRVRPRWIVNGRTRRTEGPVVVIREQGRGDAESGPGRSSGGSPGTRGFYASMEASNGSTRSWSPADRRCGRQPVACYRVRRPAPRRHEQTRRGHGPKTGERTRAFALSWQAEDLDRSDRKAYPTRRFAPVFSRRDPPRWYESSWLVGPLAHVMSP